MASGRFVVAIVRRCAHGTRSSFLAAQNGLQPTSLVLTSEHFKKNNTVGLRVQPRSVRYQSVALVTRCPPGPVKGYSVSSHVTLLQPSRTHSTDPEELGRLKRGWMKIARLIKAFMDGTKALYKDVRLMYELRKRSGSLVISRHAPRESASGKVEFPFTWDEVQFMYRTKRDMIAMLPIVVVFFIPLIGYAVPVVVFMYPHKLLSQHFWTAEQRQEFSEKKASIRRDHYRSVAALIKEGGTEEQRQSLSSLSRELHTPGGHPDWEKFRKLFSLKKLPKTHLETLISSWGVASKLPLPLTYQRRHLEKHLHYLFLTDWLIQSSGGVGALSLQDIAQACDERGLRGDTDEMKEALDSWVCLSTSYRDCPVELLAHFPVVGLMDVSPGD